MISTFLQGLFLSLGLIVAIGAQNAFLLRQGLKREHVGALVAFFIFSDALLITLSVLGMSQAISENKQLARALAFGGALFLAWYGWQAFMRIKNAGHLKASEINPKLSLKAALLQAFTFTYLNPHLYIDTALIGNLGAQQPDDLLIWFLSGSISASFLWFISLGFGAKKLTPLFQKPRAWQIFDFIIGIIMWTLSISLIIHGLRI